MAKKLYLTAHPSSQRFYRVLALVMGVLGLNSEHWPWFAAPRAVVYRVHRAAMPAVVPFSVGMQVLYLVVYYDELPFETLYMIITICPIALIILSKYYIAQTESFKIIMEDFMTKLHIYYTYETEREEYIQKALITAEQFSRWSCFYYTFFCYVCYVSFESVPIIHNLQRIESYSNITFRLDIIVHMWLPFDYEFNFVNWAITQTIMVYIGFIAITYIVLFDTVNMAIIYHLIGQIHIFKHRITLKFNSKNNNTQETIKKYLIETSQDYLYITKTVKKIEAAFGVNVATIYIHNLFSGGVFLYQIMTSSDTETFLTYGMLIPIYSGILIAISIALENIRISAEDIPDLIYAINWQNWSISNQKMLLMLLVQVQPTLEFEAAFKIKTGVQPALSIIKTTFSLYVMIKQTV